MAKDCRNLVFSFRSVVERIGSKQVSEMVEESNFRSNVRKFFSFISVEPFVLCWVLPSCILIVAMENLNLEKACRVNLGFSHEICENMINKTIHNIDCANVDLSSNETIVDPDIKLAHDVCLAETESQKILAVVFGLRSPIAAIFPLIIVLFAGGWSDKKGIRKPLVLFPILGELIAAIILLFSAMFMDEVPMEVPAYSERVIPSLFGGQTLMLMGIYSYLTGKKTVEVDLIDCNDSIRILQEQQLKKTEHSASDALLSSSL